MALIEACKSNDTNSSIVDSYGRTTLIWACHYKMEEVALELIKTGHAIPEHISRCDGNTALIWACGNAMKEVALELIKTGKSNPDHIATDGNTALSWACENSMKEVVYELVSIGTFTINDLMSLKLEWVPEEFIIMNPVDVTEIDI